jgi:hypothetical protein
LVFFTIYVLAGNASRFLVCLPPGQKPYGNNPLILSGIPDFTT